MELEYTKKEYEISIYKNELSNDYEEEVENLKKISYFRQNKIACIGCNYQKSPIDACSPKFTKNINGKLSLTFSMYYTFYNYNTHKYEKNPFIDLIQNDTLIELKFDGEYYDLIIVKIQKDSDNTIYNFTAESASIIELGKNGFNVELDTELKNNMGTINELGNNILKYSDWEVAPKLIDGETEEGIYSDLIIQTLEDALFEINFEQPISIIKRSDYLPDAYYIHDVIDYSNNPITGLVYAFYDDVINKREEIGILYTGNEAPIQNSDGVIVNSYNYTVSKDIIFNVINQEEDLSNFRGRRVVRSLKQRYDQYLDRVVSFYKSSDSSDTTEYFGYNETDYDSPVLTENYLSNSSNPTSLVDWNTVTIDSSSEGNERKDNDSYRLYHETMPYPSNSPYVSYLSISPNTIVVNKGVQGHRSNIKHLYKGEKFILAYCYETQGYEHNINISSDKLNNIKFSLAFYQYRDNQIRVDDEDEYTVLSDAINIFDNAYGGDSHINKYIINSTSFSFDNTKTFIIEDEYDKERKETGISQVVKTKKYAYMELSCNIDIPDLTDQLGLNQDDQIIFLGAFFENANSEEFKLYDTMFFKEEFNKNGLLIYPGRIPDLSKTEYATISEELIKNYNYIYKINQNNNASELVWFGEGLENKVNKISYIPIYEPNYEKVSTISGKEKNYYTMLSDLTKKFECWADYIIVRDENGNIRYKNIYYDLSTGKQLKLTNNSELTLNNIGKFTIDSTIVNIIDQEIEYQWEQKYITTTNEAGKIQYNEQTDTYSIDGIVYPTKKISYEENFIRYYDNSVEPNGALKEIELNSRILDNYSLNYIYIVDFTSEGEYPTVPPKFFMLKYSNTIKLTVKDSNNIAVLKKPIKYVRFRKYLNDTPNWAGFKYGINMKSIQRTEDNSNFSTKVIVKNNSNEFAKNKFCSIARSQYSETRDNFIIDFGYYLRQNMLDNTELNNDLYGINGYLTQIRNLNISNENNTELFADYNVKRDHIQGEWETYYLADQAAAENIQKYQKMINNCGEQYHMEINEDWNIGGLLPIRKNLVIVKSANNNDDIIEETSDEIFTGINVDKETVYIYDDVKEKYISPLEKYDVPVIYYIISDDIEKFAKGSYCRINSSQLKVQTNIEKTTGKYYFLADKNIDLAGGKQYHTYYWEDNQWKEYHNKEDYRFNDCIRSYCERIDEDLLKRMIYGEMAKKLKSQLNEIDDLILNTMKLGRNYNDRKNAIQHLFLLKYSDFIRESHWNSDDYYDDDLYYLSARDSLHVAAYPKISYTINVADVEELENYNCYNFKIGDYTFIEDTEFFGWDIDGSGRPAKEWVVVTEATYDLEQPSNNSIKVQNYKTQLEDLFSRLSASIQSLELNQGGYNRSIEGIARTTQYNQYNYDSEIASLKEQVEILQQQILNLTS